MVQALTSDRFTVLRRMLLFAVIALAIYFIMPDLALAASKGSGAGGAIEKGVEDGAGAIWKVLTAVVLPIAAVLFAWNVFRAIFGGERGMESAKRNIFIIVVVIALVFLAPIIIDQVGGWFKGSATGFKFTNKPTFSG